MGGYTLPAPIAKTVRPQTHKYSDSDNDPLMSASVITDTTVESTEIPGLGEIKLVIACPWRHPQLRDEHHGGYRRRLVEIEAAELCPPADVPSVPTVVILGVLGTRTIAGLRLRRGTEMAYPGLEVLSGALSDVEVEGINEVKGLWVASRLRRRGVATHLVQKAVGISASTGSRWLVALANEYSVNALCRVGFEPDPRFVGLPFPNDRFESSLVWLDHEQASPRLACAA